MNWKRVVRSLEQSSSDKQNEANKAAVLGLHDKAERLDESAFVLREIAYALKVGLEAAE